MQIELLIKLMSPIALYTCFLISFTNITVGILHSLFGKYWWIRIKDDKQMRGLVFPCGPYWPGGIGLKSLRDRIKQGLIIPPRRQRVITEREQKMEPDQEVSCSRRQGRR